MRLIRAYQTDFTKMSVAFAFLATVPLWISQVGLYNYIALEIGIWCIYAMGFNLALGYTGLPSFGHGAFFGVGAYAMAIYQLNFGGTNLWLGLLIAVLAGIVSGGITGALISHRRGIYFSLLTIAFGQMFWFLAIKLRHITKGEDGLLNLDRLPADFGFFSIPLDTNVRLYYFTFIVLIVVVIGLWILIRSPFGYIIRALKQNETRAQFLGYNITFFKWMSFTISTAIAGLAGGMFALVQQSAFPDVMSLHLSGIIVMMTIVGGGLVSYWGPIVGVIFYFVMREFVGSFSETWLLWFGLSFMAVIVFQPEGLAGMSSKIWKRTIGSLHQNRIDKPVPQAKPSEGV